MAEETEKENEGGVDKSEAAEAQGEAEISALKEQIEGLTNKWKRAVADYQNLEKRIARDRQGWQKFSNTVLISKLIPLSDNLERAASHSRDEGLELIIKDLKKVLSSEGVKEIEVKIGDPFNPHWAECVEMIEDGEEEKIVEVVAKGYIIGDRVLRPAKVKVSKKKTGPLDPGTENETEVSDSV
jgi:molecular chaperone GrpE